MSSVISTLDTSHEDMIHDCQFDYYAKRLATSSSDRTIKIFEVGDNGQNQQVAEIKGHEGPVWQIGWAHPKFGPILASCSYDRKVIVWKESPVNVWNKLYEYEKHDSSVNSIAWAPHEHGLILVCGSSDGRISVLTYKNDESGWDVSVIQNAHAIGVNAVSWAPAIPSGSLVAGGNQVSYAPKRFVSGGCDNLVKIWKLESDNNWKVEEKFEHHTAWVRDVAWAPSIGLPSNTIASCSQDGTVVIWSQESSSWSKKVLPKVSDVVNWRVTWSITGNILAVSGDDNKVTLWKEGLDSEWKCIEDLDESDTNQN